MNIVKSITIASLIAAVSNFAFAGGVEQHGRGTQTEAGVNVSSVGSNINVQLVQGRSAIVRNILPNNFFGIQSALLAGNTIVASENVQTNSDLTVGDVRGRS